MSSIKDIYQLIESLGTSFNITTLEILRGAWKP